VLIELCCVDRIVMCCGNGVCLFECGGVVDM
jgi:hypothetical protein